MFILTGGVCSGLGKGNILSCIGHLFKTDKKSLIKIDPYLNTSAGLMSPIEHGEVYVTDDGYETDIDLYTYRSYNKNIEIDFDSSITLGRAMKYMLDNELKNWNNTTQIKTTFTGTCVEFVKKKSDYTKKEVVLVEVGGCYDDIETTLLHHTISKLYYDKEHEAKHIHMCPLIKIAGQYKTKPIQRSIEGMKIPVDILIIRHEEELTEEQAESVRRKVSAAQVQQFSVFFVRHVRDKLDLVEECIKSGLINIIPKKERNNNHFRNKIAKKEKIIKFLIIGKYGIQEAYNILTECIKFTCVNVGIKPQIGYIFVCDESIVLEQEKQKMLEHDIIIFSGGFGHRHTEKLIELIRFARERNMLTIGICFGFQLMMLEFIMNVVGKPVTSTELSGNVLYKDHEQVIRPVYRKNFLVQKDIGLISVSIKPETFLQAAYKSNNYSFTHRNSYCMLLEDYKKYNLDDYGMKLAAVSEDDKKVEAFEYGKNKFYVGTQFHLDYQADCETPNKVFEMAIDWHNKER